MSEGGRWERGVVRFDDAAAFDRELDAFICKGAVRLRGDGDALPAPLEPFDFSLAPPAGAPLKLRGMIVSTSGGFALVQILDFSNALSGELRRRATNAPPAGPAGPPPGSAPAPVELEVLAPTARAVTPTSPPPLLVSALSGAAPPPASAAGGEPFDGPLEWATPAPQTGVFAMAPPAALAVLDGKLVNPQGPAGLASLPLGPVAAVRDLATVSTVGLVRFLGARRASGELTLRGDGGGERRVSIERGAYLLSPQEREGLRVAFQWPAGTYRFEPGVPQRPPHRLPTPAWRLVLDAVKLVIRDTSPDEIARLTDADKAIRLSAAFAERARAIDLQPGEERVVKRDFDGRLSLRELIKLGALSELNLRRLVYLLHVLGLAELVAPQAGGAPAEDEVRAHYERVVGTDLFTALGVHWTDPPTKIDAGLATMRREYGPGSAAAAASPEYAAKLVELAERAHRRLKDRAGRRAHRAEMGVDVRHAAELIAQKVPIERSRGETVKAHDLIAAACDLVDRPDWERLRQELAVLLPTRGR